MQHVMALVFHENLCAHRWEQEAVMGESASTKKEYKLRVAKQDGTLLTRRNSFETKEVNPASILTSFLISLQYFNC